MKKRCQMYSFSLKIQYQLRHLVESFKLKVYLFLDRLLKDVSKISENLKPSLWGRGRGFWLIDLHPEPPRDVLPQAIVVGAEAQVFNRIEGGADRDTAMEGGSADKIGWISVCNARFPIKQRYHYNVADERLHQHVEKDNEDGLYISCVASAANLWALIMDAGTGFSSQVYELSAVFLPKDWIMEQWEKNYYITSIAGATNGRSLVVMSKGTPYTQQSYKVNESFPLKWINKKWKEGFHFTSITTAGNRWGVVMSRNSGFSEQVVELDFLYPGEGIHRLLESGYQITSMAATADQSAFILSVPKLKMMDETQETLRTSAFPSTHAKDMWSKNCYVRSLCYGRTVC